MFGPRYPRHGFYIDLIFILLKCWLHQLPSVNTYVSRKAITVNLGCDLVMFESLWIRSFQRHMQDRDCSLIAAYT